MTLSLNAAIASAPRALFGDKDKGAPPKFRKIFAHVVKAILKDQGQKFDEKTVDLVSEAVNPSSFQRQVADHRATLTGKIKDGKYLPVEEKAPKKERGKPRAKAKAKAKADVDELGLPKGKKGKKAEKPKAKKLKAKDAIVPPAGAGGQKTNNSSKNPEFAKAKAKAAAEKAVKATVAKKAEKPSPAPEKAAKAPKADKKPSTGLDAIAAARAALAAKKAAKAKPEAEVEI